jgi:hypothetical protein
MLEPFEIRAALESLAARMVTPAEMTGDLQFHQPGRQR